MDRIEQAVASKDWEFLVKNFLPVNFVDSLSFVEVMHLVGNLFIESARRMVEDGMNADLMRDYAVNLMIILRAKNREEWEEDWKNEAFLGIVCTMIYREEEGFVYVKNAYDAMDDSPQSLIFAYLNAGRYPGCRLPKDEIVQLTKRASQKGVTCESAERMASLADAAGDEETHQYWKNRARQAEKDNLHTPIITPNALKEMFEPEEGYTHEE